MRIICLFSNSFYLNSFRVHSVEYCDHRCTYGNFHASLESNDDVWLIKSYTLSKLLPVLATALKEAAVITSKSTWIASSNRLELSCSQSPTCYSGTSTVQGTFLGPRPVLIRPQMVDEETISGCATTKSLFIIHFISWKLSSLWLVNT